MKQWIVFRNMDTGQELCSYTVKGTFKGEAEETRNLLAYENGLQVDRISITIEER